MKVLKIFRIFFFNTKNVVTVYNMDLMFAGKLRVSNRWKNLVWKKVHFQNVVFTLIKHAMALTQ